MVIYLGFLYLFFGIIFLFIPLIYVELGRPRDFIKAGLNLIIGLFLIVKYYVFDNFFSTILIFFTILLIFFLVEIFSMRLNQLTNQEKNKLRTLLELKKNVFTLVEAINLAWKNFLSLSNTFKFGVKNENLNKKK